MRVATMIVGGVFALLLLAMLLAACPRPATQQTLPAPPCPVQKKVALRGCTLHGNFVVCDCTPVRTTIDSKTGRTSVECKFRVED